MLDCVSDADTIQEAFSDYHRTTALSEDTNPNRLHDFKTDLDSYQVYNWEQIDMFVKFYRDGADHRVLDPILDTRVEAYRYDLDEDGQVDFKGNAQGVLANVRVLGSDPVAYVCRLGDVVDIPELPSVEVARAY